MGKTKHWVIATTGSDGITSHYNLIIKQKPNYIDLATETWHPQWFC